MRMIFRFFYHLISFVVFCGGVFAFFVIVKTIWNENLWLAISLLLICVIAALLATFLEL